MAFNPEVALFNLLEDAQTAAEVLQIIEDYVANSQEHLGGAIPPIIYSLMESNL